MKRFVLLFYTLLAASFLLNLSCTEKIKNRNSYKTLNNDSTKGIIFLQHHNEFFREGLRRHSLLDHSGYRQHNTGLIKQHFGEKWAKAKLEGDKVVVWNSKIKKPVAVRYAWAANPICNLYNGADLPASPFRTDDWKGLTFGKK